MAKLCSLRDLGMFCILVPIHIFFKIRHTERVCVWCGRCAGVCGWCSAPAKEPASLVEGPGGAREYNPVPAWAQGGQGTGGGDGCLLPELPGMPLIPCLGALRVGVWPLSMEVDGDHADGEHSA